MTNINDALAYYVADAMGHATAAMKKAAQFRQSELNQFYKSSSLAPAVADSLIAGEFIHPKDRDNAIQRMCKPASALELMQHVIAAAVPKDKTRNDFGQAVKTASYNTTDELPESERIWRDMIY